MKSVYSIRPFWLCQYARKILPDRRATPQKPHIMSDYNSLPTGESGYNEREVVIDEVIQYILRNKVGKFERAETRIERGRRRALRRRRNRIQQFTDPGYANAHIAELLQGHPETLRTETRLTRYQFESLTKWLKDNTKLERSRHVGVDAKLGIFLYIASSGCPIQTAGAH